MSPPTQSANIILNIIHEERCEGTGPMTTQQPFSKGANAGIHEAKSNGTETAAMAVFFVPGKGGVL